MAMKEWSQSRTLLYTKNDFHQVIGNTIQQKDIKNISTYLLLLLGALVLNHHVTLTSASDGA